MLEKLLTEQRNKNTMNLDEMSVHEILTTMNKEDEKVPQAVAKEIDQIEKAVRQVIKAFKSGGRLLYVGAGTSGRLGILDAVECPPTFGALPDQVQGFIAGGMKAFTKAVEGAEDKESLGEKRYASDWCNKQ